MVAAGYAVEHDVLPGRPWLRERLGLNGPDGVVPDVEPGPTRTGTLSSAAVPGTEVGWAVTAPPGATGVLPVVVALHALGGDHSWPLDLGIDRYLADAVAGGVAPFAVATVDGGTSYWHPHGGEDRGALVVDDLLPMLDGFRIGGARLTTERIGLIGWSMGGYGALRLGPVLGAPRVRAVVAVSPALWSDPEDARPSGFSDAAEYLEYSVLDRQADLDGIRVRVDCGRGDPFFRTAQDYVDGFDREIAGSWEAGGHDVGYWRRMLPAELAFLGAELA